MSVTVRAILDEVRRDRARIRFETITFLGLLLERHAMRRYDDPIYAQLYLPAGWLELRLGDDELDEIVRALLPLLDDPRLASTAAFALGKAYSDLAVPGLVAALRRVWRTDDRTAYQLLVALDNHGLERALDVVQRIAREGLERSKDLARQILRVERELEAPRLLS